MMPGVVPWWGEGGSVNLQQGEWCFFGTLEGAIEGDSAKGRRGGMCCLPFVRLRLSPDRLKGRR